MRAAAEDLRLEPQLRRHRADVARRLHHPLGLPGQDQGGLRQRTRSWSTCCSTRSSRRRSRSAQAAWRRVVIDGGRAGHPDAGDQRGAGLLRRLPQRAAAGQPAPGPARLLRRAHLRARRQAARRVLPHQLDRPRRHHRGLDLYRSDLTPTKKASRVGGLFFAPIRTQNASGQSFWAA